MFYFISFSFHFSLFQLLLSYFILLYFPLFCLPLGLEDEDKIAHLNSQALLVGIIKTTFTSRILLFSSYCTYMDNLTEKNSTSIIDIWILFSLSGSSRYRSKVHTLCAKKYSNGSLTGVSLESAIYGFGTALESVFPSILILGENRKLLKCVIFENVLTIILIFFIISHSHFRSCPHSHIQLTLALTLILILILILIMILSPTLTLALKPILTLTHTLTLTLSYPHSKSLSLTHPISLSLLAQSAMSSVRLGSIASVLQSMAVDLYNLLYGEFRSPIMR